MRQLEVELAGLTRDVTDARSMRNSLQVRVDEESRNVALAERQIEDLKAQLGIAREK